MKDFLLKRPMILCAIGCIITVLSGVFFPVALIFLSVVLMAVFVLLQIKNSKEQFLIVVILILTVLFSTVSDLSEIKRITVLDKTSATVEFTVQNIAYKTTGYYIAEVKISEKGVLEKGTKLLVSYYDGRLRVGDTIKAKVVFSKIEKYKLNYYSENIFLSANIEEYEILRGKSNKFLKGVERLRCYIKETIFEFVSYDEAATLCAVLSGDKNYFPNEFYNNVIKSGVSHVMVVSGMHLTIFVTMFTFLFKKYLRNRYIIALLQLFAVFIISSVCGFTVSVLRAGVMYVISSIGIMIKRKSVLENTLAAAVCFILAVSPLVIFSIAFQLSVLSTFGIVAVAFPIDRFIKQRKIVKNRFFKWVITSLLISLFATIFTLPILIYVFGFVSTVGVITTILISYPVTLSIWISVISLAIKPLFPFFAEQGFILCEYCLKLTNYVINKMGNLDFSVVYTDKIWAVAAMVLIILIFCFLIACKKRLDMLKLEQMRRKIIKEGTGSLKWR